MKIAILGIAYTLPEQVETNDDLQRANPDWRMLQLFEKSGIWSRHIAAEGETASDLGYQAATTLLSRNLVSVEEIDYLIYCSQSPDYFLPSTACVLQKRLNLGVHVGAFDYNLGCSGFVYGLQIANALIVSGSARNVLLITADTYTKYIHPRDRTVRTLFGDGGAATLIGGARGAGSFGGFLVGTDGGGECNLIVATGGLRTPRTRDTSLEVTDNAGCTRTRDNLFMDGPEIFSFALSRIPRAVADHLDKSKLSIDDVDMFVYHQANKYMLDSLAKKSGIPEAKMLVDVHDQGNTVSSSIPIALQRAVTGGRIASGQRLVLVGFGVGYSWGVCDLVWD